MIHYYLAVLKKYAVFTGRASRAEYWYFFLCNLIISFILGLIEGLLEVAPYTDESLLVSLYILLILIPSIAVTVRRLHDTNHSGWWYFIAFIPLVGPIILLILLVQDSDSGENKYGPNPKEIKEESQKEVIYCSKCGNKLDCDSKFCIKCGAKI